MPFQRVILRRRSSKGATEDPKEIGKKPFVNKKIGTKLPSKEITPSTQGELFSTVERDVGGIGMGVL
jgi:hypothetical protein